MINFYHEGIIMIKHLILMFTLVSVCASAAHALPSASEVCAKEAFSYPTLKGTSNGAAFMELHNRGCFVMLSNSDTPLIEDLFSKSFPRRSTFLT